MIAGQASDWAAARSDKWRRQIAGLEAMLAPIDGPLIDALALDGAARIADIGCGGGATTRAALAAAAAGSEAHGYDLSPALIEVARRRVPAEPRGAVFEVADVGAASPPRHRYDRLISRMGVVFFPQPASAFANLRRWLAPGGRFAFAVWGPLEDNVWMSETRAAVADVVPQTPVDPSTPGPFRYGDATPLLADLEGAGFVGLDLHDWRQPLPIGDRLAADDAARFALAAFSQFAEQLADAGTDAIATAHRSLRRRFAPYEQEGGVFMPARVHIVSGRVRRPQ